MIPDRRTYALSKDQPILRQARRRPSVPARDLTRVETEFWRSFDLDKLGHSTRRVAAAREAGRP